LQTQSIFHPSLSNDLNKGIQRYKHLFSTKQAYSSVKKHFVDFIHLFKRTTVKQCLPATETLLTEFVVYLAKV
jgi:hypothetical protein